MGKWASRCVALVGLTVLGGCATNVQLSSSEYVPHVRDEKGTYAGQHVYLETPQNQAENTTIFAYYGEGVRFGGPALTSYLWYVLEKALMRVGMVVHERPPSFPVSRLNLTFTSWTDREFVGVVGLEGTGYRRELRVVFPPAPDPAVGAEQLKAFAYGQIDLIVAEILSDPAFAEALIRVESAPAADAAPPAGAAIPSSSAAAPQQTDDAVMAPAGE